MTKLSVYILIILLFFTGCCAETESFDIVATTLPVFDFTSALCEDTPLKVGRLVTENVSCLHDYTLKVDQMRMIENAELVVISGAGLEDFLQDVLHDTRHVIDSSVDAHIHNAEHQHNEDNHTDHDHHHDTDPHLWLSPENACIMANNICAGLSETYPEYADTFLKNLDALESKLFDLQAYGNRELSQIQCRELITFHDGFAYLAESFELTILEAIEEESGSEASAAQIIHLIDLVNQHGLPAVFTEHSGSDSCAGIISAETGVQVYTLDMVMAGDSYFDSMYRNIDTIKEALE